MCVCVLRASVYTHAYIYIYICVCVCVAGVGAAELLIYYIYMCTSRLQPHVPSLQPHAPGAAELEASRVVVVNTWRSLHSAPVRRQPLVLVDRYI